MAPFDSSSYGPAVARFLSGSPGIEDLIRVDAASLFPQAPYPREAMAGLWLFLGDLDRAHTISQDLSTPEAAFWHGIMHRREPDPANAAYWFRRVGRHTVFPALWHAAAEVGYTSATPEWDPLAWIDFWESSRRRPGSAERRIAIEVQRVEWEILFDHCAHPEKPTP